MIRRREGRRGGQLSGPVQGGSPPTQSMGGQAFLRPGDGGGRRLTEPGGWACVPRARWVGRRRGGRGGSREGRATPKH